MENENKSSEEPGTSPLDDLINREVHPVKRRVKKKATFLVSVVVVVGFAFVIWLLLNGALSSSGGDKKVIHETLFSSSKIPVPKRLPHAVVTESHLPKSDPANEKLLSPEPQIPSVKKEPQSDIALKVPFKKESTEIKPISEVLSLVSIGPFITSSRLKEAEQFLTQKDVSFTVKKGQGIVKMLRLRAGIFSPEVARKRVDEMHKMGFPSFFVLPEGGKLAVYAGSFIDRKRAELLTQKLGQKNIKVSRIEVDLQKRGQIIVVPNVSSVIVDLLNKEFNSKGIHVESKVIK